MDQNSILSLVYFGYTLIIGIYCKYRLIHSSSWQVIWQTLLDNTHFQDGVITALIKITEVLAWAQMWFLACPFVHWAVPTLLGLQCFFRSHTSKCFLFLHLDFHKAHRVILDSTTNQCTCGRHEKLLLSGIGLHVFLKIAMPIVLSCIHRSPSNHYIIVLAACAYGNECV